MQLPRSINIYAYIFKSAAWLPINLRVHKRLKGMSMPHAKDAQDAAPKKGRPVLSAKEVSGRREEIAHVALRLFKDEGYQSVSMRRLGKEVGLTPMALYRYFPSKLDILATLWAHILGLAFEQVLKATNAKQDPLSQLEAASLAYVTYWFENVEHYHLVFMSAGVSKSDVTSFVSQPEVTGAYRVFFESVAALRGEAAETEGVKRASDGLICHLHGIMHSLITMQGYDWSERDDLVRDAVNRVAHPVELQGA